MATTTDPSVHQLMHFTTKHSTAASKATAGGFTKAGGTEFVLMLHDAIELYRLNTVVERFTMIHRQQLHGTLLNVATITCGDHTGAPDLLALTSESGYLTILRYEESSGGQSGWKVVANEMIGKSGVRSTVPGEYLAVDPQGRCVFAGATFKERVIFGIKSRTDVDAVELMSPLEARRLTCVFGVVAIDCPSSSPTFAALESPMPGGNTSQSALGQKFVCFYQYDTNLNQVRTVPVQVPSDATFIAPCFNTLPGVLVGTPYSVYWLSIDSSRGLVEVPMPMRQDLRTQYAGSLLVASAYFKSPKGVFFIVQNEHGDIYRIQFEDPSSPVEYFGRAQPGIAMLILKGGFLLIACETGDHQLFKIVRDRFPASHLTGSAALRRENETLHVRTFSSTDNSNMASQQLVTNTSPSFSMRMGSAVRGRMRYFSLTHSNQLHCTSYGLSTSASQGLTISKSDMNHMFVLRDPTPIVREGVSIHWDSRIVVSHRQETTVYTLCSTADMRLPEEPESRLAFDRHSPTIFATLLDGGCFLQVTPGAVHAIRGVERSSWYASTVGRIIHKACANKRQIVVSFVSGGAATLSFDARIGTLELKAIVDTPPVSAVCLPPLKGGSLATVVGIAMEGPKDEKKERFFTFEFSSLRPRSKPVDTIAQSDAGIIRYTSSHMTYLGDGHLYTFLGTSAGQLIWMCLNATGDIASIDQCKLGSAPCRLISGNGEAYCYAQSDEVWRCSFDDGHHQRVPVSIPFAPEIIERFDDPHGRAGLLTVHSDKIIPFTLDVCGSSQYTTRSVQLSAPGRKMERVLLGETNQEILVIASKEGDGSVAKCVLQTQDTALQFTCNPEVLPQGESIVSMTTGVIPCLGSSPVVLVGIARDFTQCPKLTYGQCFIALYTFNGLQLVPQHKYRTPLDDLPSAIHITHTGHVIVGMGEEHGLLVLEGGRTRFMQKHRLTDIDSRIVSIDSSRLKSPYGGSASKPTFLLACGTADKSVCLVRFHNTDAYQFLVRVGGDAVPRNIITLRFVGDTSIVSSDRFGNITFFAIPPGLITDLPDVGTRENPRMGLRDDAESQRQSQLLKCTAQFHVGQVVNSIDIVNVTRRDTNTSQAVVVYSTILGSAGCFVPFQREEDAVLCVLVEPHIKSNLTSHLNRSVYAHQSSFYPPCGVVDGDLIQQFVSSGQTEETINGILRDTTASDKRLKLFNNDVPRFEHIKRGNLVSELNLLVGRTKPASIF